MNFSKFGISAMAAVMLSTGIAFATPLVHLTTHGYIVRGTQAAPKLEEFSPTSEPRSGDLIEWKVIAKNDGRDAAKRLVTNLPIPSSTQYIAGTATGSTGVSVSFSIDGGKTFSAKPMRVFHTANGDVSKPVEVTSYTTVRWTYESDLAANSSASFSYEAKVK